MQTVRTWIAFVCRCVVSGHVAERTNLRYFLVVGMCSSGFFTALFGLGRYWHIHSLSFYIIVQVLRLFCFSFLNSHTLKHPAYKNITDFVERIKFV